MDRLCAQAALTALELLCSCLFCWKAWGGGATCGPVPGPYLPLRSAASPYAHCPLRGKQAQRWNILEAKQQAGARSWAPAWYLWGCPGDILFAPPTPGVLGSQLLAAIHPLVHLGLGRVALPSVLPGWSPSRARKLWPHRHVIRLVRGAVCLGPDGPVPGSCPPSAHAHARTHMHTTEIC